MGVFAGHEQKKEELNMLKRIESLLVVIACCACGGAASADVVIDTVAVGNPGNAGELSGSGAGGYGPTASAAPWTTATTSQSMK